MVKRIIAFIGIGLILLMYGLTAVFAFLAKPETNQLFLASMVMTFIVPVVLWAFLKLYEVAHRDDGISISEMRNINKRLKNGENPEQIAKEIEEKYK